MNTPKTTIAIALTILIGLTLYVLPSHAEDFTINLKQGENLISVPLVPQDTSIPQVLSSIAGAYTDVWRLDPSDAIDPWKHYNPGYIPYNDLTTIDYGKGYRLFVSRDCVLTVAGNPPTQNYTFNLKSGWNLIGWPFVYSQSIPAALSGLQFGVDYDQIARINPLTKEQEDYYNDPVTNGFNTFEPGRAYYVYCLKDATVTVASPTGQYPIYSDRSATTAYWVDASSYRSLAEAVSAIGPQEKTLLIPNVQNISSSITIPKNIVLKFTKGGKLTIPSEVTVTINGGVDAELFQIFDCTGTGKVSLGRGAVKEVYPQWWGAKADGVADDTAAIRLAIAAVVAQGGGEVYFPAGTYLITDTITIDDPFINLVGGGMRGITTLLFQPTSGKTMLYFYGDDHGGTYSNSVRNMTLQTLNANEEYAKVAIETNNLSEFCIENVWIGYWYGNNASIGLKLKGREAISVKNVTIYADSCIYIAHNPDYTTIDLDHAHFENLYLVAVKGNVIEVETGVQINNITFDGYQSWVPLSASGAYGFYWNDTTSVGASLNLSFKNVRIEQEKDAGKYLFYIRQNYCLYGLLFENCFGGAKAKGYYLRGVHNVSFRNITYCNPAANTPLDADYTVYPIIAENFTAQTGTPSFGALERKFSSGNIGTGQNFIYDRVEAGVPFLKK